MDLLQPPNLIFKLTCCNLQSLYSNGPTGHFVSKFLVIILAFKFILTASISSCLMKTIKYFVDVLVLKSGSPHPKNSYYSRVYVYWIS